MGALADLTTSDFLQAMESLDELSLGFLPEVGLSLTPRAREALVAPEGASMLADWAMVNSQIIEDLNVFRGLLASVPSTVTQDNVASAMEQLNLLLGDLNSRLEDSTS